MCLCLCVYVCVLLRHFLLLYSLCRPNGLKLKKISQTLIPCLSIFISDNGMTGSSGWHLKWLRDIVLKPLCQEPCDFFVGQGLEIAWTNSPFWQGQGEFNPFLARPVDSLLYNSGLDCRSLCATCSPCFSLSLHKSYCWLLLVSLS